MCLSPLIAAAPLGLSRVRDVLHIFKPLIVNVRGGWGYLNAIISLLKGGEKALI